VSNYFKDFMQPAKIIFDRLQQQRDKKIVINGHDGSITTPTSVIPPYYPDLPEYPCKLIRGADGKVTEVQYGESSRGFVWRQILVRGADGKLDHIKQENPDGSFNIVLHRNTTTNKVEVVDVE